MLIAPGLCDQSWDFEAKGRYSIEDAHDDADTVFTRLKNACKTAWSPYIRLRVLHDDKPDRCSPVEAFADKKGALHFKHGKNPRGPLVLRTYQRGKLPKVRSRKRGRK